MFHLSRRDVLASAAGAGFALAIGKPGLAANFPPPADIPFGDLFDAWLTVAPDGRVTLTGPEAEMGQGTNTALAQLVAEEFEIPWESIQVRTMTAAPGYANPIFGLSTGASMSIKGRYDQMRRLGAAARMMMVGAAAARWGVQPASCVAANGRVQSGARSLGYGELAEEARRQPIPKSVPLKPASAWRVIGKSLPRVDMADKCTGKVKYGYDQAIPGMVFAAVVHSPVFGGKVKAVDSAPALAIKGVQEVVAFETWVACVASNTWAALQGAEALSVTWDEGAYAGLDDAGIDAASRQAGAGAFPAKQAGDIGQALAAPGAVTARARYTTPYLDHACMEPTSAVALVSAEGVQVWSATQSPRMIYLAAKLLFDLPEEKVKVHQALIGSSFGRRGVIDAELQAMVLSKRLGRPVKAIRSRAEDIQHGFYRPAQFTELEGAAAGARITAWRQTNASQSILDNYARYFSDAGISAAALAQETGPAGPSRINMAPFDFMSVDGSPFNGVYDIPNVDVRTAKLDLPVPVGMWRGVGQTSNIFVVESFIDELGHAAGADPLDLRLAMLKGQPRLENALLVAAKAVGWGKRRPGIGHGIALTNLSESASAMIAEVEMKDGVLTMRRFVNVVDVGTAINPDIVKAQVEGGLLFGLGAALWGRVSLKNGRVEQTNFHDFPVMTLRHAPEIEVILVKSQDPPTTISESTTPLVAPALCNAIFAAVGTRIRDLPIIREGLSLA